MMIGVVIVLGVVLSRTIAGRYMYAAGSNAEAARLAGVRVQWIKLVTFTISGGAAALGGIIDASRVLSAQASNGGTALTFTVLAASWSAAPPSSAVTARSGARSSACFSSR